MGSVHFDSSLSDDERRARLYAGDVFMLSPTDGSRALIEPARRILEQAFASHDPRMIHKRITAEEVAGDSRQAKRPAEGKAPDITAIAQS